MSETSKKIRVCYFGTFSRGEEYARNNAIINGLIANGVKVDICQVDLWPTHDEKMAGTGKGLFTQARAFLKAYLRLTFKYLKVPGHDYLFVGNIGHIDVFPARVLAWLRAKPVVFDAFFSLYDTVIEDRKLYSPGSIQARLLRFIDRWSCRLSDLVLLDTNEHIDYFCREFGLDRSRFLALPPGTDQANFYPRPEPEDDGILDCISCNSYIPLHGIDVQLDAAALLKDEDDIRFTLVGKGQLYQEMRDRAQERKLENVHFIEGWFTHAELSEMIASADVAFGVFGVTEKARRVIPYKVYNSLAMKKPVITGGSPPAREFFEDGVQALLSPLGDAQALAEQIVRLRDDPGLRKRIAGQGHELFLEKCTSAGMGKAIVEELEKRWPRK